MSLDQFSERYDPQPERQAMLYPLDTIKLIEYEPFTALTFTEEQCTPILGIEVCGRWQVFTHVIRKRAQTSLPRSTNEPHRGLDKLVFFNHDVNDTFHWQATYSTALFLSEDYKIFKA
jgi:hypothetical protein